MALPEMRMTDSTTAPILIRRLCRQSAPNACQALFIRKAPPICLSAFRRVPRNMRASSGRPDSARRPSWFLLLPSVQLVASKSLIFSHIWRYRSITRLLFSSLEKIENDNKPQKRTPWRIAGNSGFLGVGSQRRSSGDPRAFPQRSAKGRRALRCFFTRCSLFAQLPAAREIRPMIFWFLTSFIFNGCIKHYLFLANGKSLASVFQALRHVIAERRAGSGIRPVRRTHLRRTDFHLVRHGCAFPLLLIDIVGPAKNSKHLWAQRFVCISRIVSPACRWRFY